MGGGDSLYEKIDKGIRGCQVVVSCCTKKYSLSANCRREVSLADALKKPIVPILLEEMPWPPEGAMSMVFTQLLYINFSRDLNLQEIWSGGQFDELIEKITKHSTPQIQNLGNDNIANVESKGSKSNINSAVQENRNGHSNANFDTKEKTNVAKATVDKTEPKANTKIGASPSSNSGKNETTQSNDNKAVGEQPVEKNNGRIQSNEERGSNNKHQPKISSSDMKKQPVDEKQTQPTSNKNPQSASETSNKKSSSCVIL